MKTPHLNFFVVLFCVLCGSWADLKGFDGVSVPTVSLSLYIYI